MAFYVYKKRLCRTRKSVEEKDNTAENTESPLRLDQKGLALKSILPEILSAFDHTIETDLDLVSIKIGPENIKSACLELRNAESLSFNYLLLLCVVDYEEYLQVVYHLYSTSKKHIAVLKVDLPSDNPSIDSVTSVWQGANWYERESHDLFGVFFENHPDLSPLLLYDGFEGYPGRRNYEMPEYKEW